MRSLASLFFSLALAGCTAGSGVDAGLPIDAAMHDDGPVDACVPPPTHELDLLLVVDDSPALLAQQATLAAAIPHLLTVLTTGDLTGDGTRDFPPFDDLHVGVIGVNMGVAGIPNIPTCIARADFGDDGILLTTSRNGGSSCMASYPRFLSFTPATSATQFATDVTCLAQTGAGGCGFEQQLDATLKALLPATSPITFYAGTHGHGDDPATNGGFLRDDSVLAILVLTEEDDCSTDHTDIWNPMSSTHTGNLNLRCIHYASELYPISRYVDGLRSLRPSRPGSTVYVTIAGVPPELVHLATPDADVDYAALFADPRMQNHLTLLGGNETLDPGCSSTGLGNAAPGIRMAQVAQGMGAGGLVQSICAADYAPALDAMVSRILTARAAPGACP